MVISTRQNITGIGLLYLTSNAGRSRLVVNFGKHEGQNKIKSYWYFTRLICLILKAGTDMEVGDTSRFRRG